MKKNNKNVFSRSSESTKTSRPSHVKKPAGKLTECQLTVDRHPSAVYINIIPCLREDLDCCVKTVL